MKKCSQCGQTQPLDQYTKSRWGKDGLRAECKKCRAAYDKARRSMPGYYEMMRKANQKYKKTEKGKEVQRRTAREHREKYPEKIKARSAAYTAVAIEGPCVMCGEKDAEERHHPDYAKEVAVLLVCNDCHNHKGGSTGHMSEGDSNG